MVLGLLQENFIAKDDASIAVSDAFIFFVNHFYWYIQIPLVCPTFMKWGALKRWLTFACCEPPVLNIYFRCS